MAKWKVINIYTCFLLFANCVNQQPKQSLKVVEPVQLQCNYGDSAFIVSAKDGSEYVEIEVDSMAAPIIYKKAMYEEATQSMTPVYAWVNELPLFVGDKQGKVNGEDALSRYINKQKLFTEGVERAQLLEYFAVIERNGSMSNIELRSKSYGTDSTAVERASRMLAEMSRDSTLWLPGKHDGVAHRVVTSLLIYCDPKAPKGSGKTTGSYSIVCPPPEKH